MFSRVKCSSASRSRYHSTSRPMRHSIPLFARRSICLAQQMPRRKIERLAGDEIFVAQNPADIRLPGKHPKGCGIGNDDQVRRPRHFVEVHPAASREGSKRRAPDASSVVVATFMLYPFFNASEERGKRDCFRARGTVRVGPRNAKQFQFFLLDARRKRLGETVLIVCPETVPFDKSARRGHRNAPHWLGFFSPFYRRQHSTWNAIAEQLVKLAFPLERPKFIAGPRHGRPR